MTWPPTRHEFLFLARTRNKRKGADNEETDQATLCSSWSETEKLTRLIGDFYPTSLPKAPYFVKPSSLSKTHLSMPRCDSGPSGLFPAGHLSIDVCYARRNTTSTVWESGGLDECHHKHACIPLIWMDTTSFEFLVLKRRLGFISAPLSYNCNPIISFYMPTDGRTVSLL